MRRCRWLTDDKGYTYVVPVRYQTMFRRWLELRRRYLAGEFADDDPRLEPQNREVTGGS